MWSPSRQKDVPATCFQTSVVVKNKLTHVMQTNHHRNTAGQQNSKEKTSEKCLDFFLVALRNGRLSVTSFPLPRFFHTMKNASHFTTRCGNLFAIIFPVLCGTSLCSPQLCTCTCKPTTHLHSDNTTRGGPVASSGTGTMWAVKLLGFGTLPGAVLLQLTPHRHVLGVARSPTNLISVIHECV